MKIFTSTLLGLIFFSFQGYTHNPEDFIIAEIEQGQMSFENEEIAIEYNAALKDSELEDFQPWIGGENFQYL